MATECRGNFFIRDHLIQSCSNFPEDTFREAIYEVFRIIDGYPLFIEDHISRFFQSVKLSGYQLNLRQSQLMEDINLLIGSNRIKTGNIKLLYRDLPDNKKELLVYFVPHQYPTKEQFRKGVDTLTLNFVRENPNAKIFRPELRKTTDLMKEKSGVYEILLIDEQGCITEGSRSNVFFIIDDRIKTPFARDVLEGITRKHVIEVILKEGIPFAEEKIHLADALRAQAVFLTGTSRKVLPVKKIDDVLFKVNHPMLRQLMAAFDQEIDNYISKTYRFPRS